MTHDVVNNIAILMIFFFVRMFVKVHVGYGDGERSSPQDLLLYDSQCWHCTPAGECNAKPNNKCVFSAQTSSVQTFRIGKSISRTEGIVTRFVLHGLFPILTQLIF